MALCGEDEGVHGSEGAGLHQLFYRRQRDSQKSGNLAKTWVVTGRTKARVSKDFLKCEHCKTGIGSQGKVQNFLIEDF